ncbi:MAG: methyltransferase domain-containing protein [Eubacterium sp.]
MEGILNWTVIEALLNPKTSKKESSNEPEKFWGPVAEMYNKMAYLEREYTQNQLDALIISREDTVLDVGCGPGRLAVPVAKMAKSVTGLDVAPEMLAHCLKNAEDAGVNNLETRLLNWEAVEIGKNLEKHDVVIASRSVGLSDLIRLNEAANRYVFLICFTQSPSLKEVYDGLFYGVDDAIKPMAPMKRMFGYNLMFNLLYDMGVNPSVKVVTDGFHADYKNREVAYDDLRKLHKVEADKEAVFRKNCDKWLSERSEGGVSFRRETESYVMWWKPQKLDI